MNPFLKLSLRILRKLENLITQSTMAYKYVCPVCENKIHNFDRLPDYYLEMFDKFGYLHSIFQSETLNYFKYSCPICGASDRNRLYALYLKSRFNEIYQNVKSIKFLDVAPEKSLTKWIKSHSFIDYRSVDLSMEHSDDIADITSLNIYESERFDIILCSHVLEHIENDRMAMQELFRVLKKGGFAIIMVPILLTLNNDLENPEWQSESDRWKYYGQNDHMRMYSKDGFVRKLYDVGFRVDQLGKDYFGVNTFELNAIHERSVLYLATK